MLPLNLNLRSPIQNRALNEFGVSLNEKLLVDSKIQCQTYPSRVHTSIKRGFIYLCIEKAAWFGLPENGRHSQDFQIAKHGVRTIRGELEFGQMERRKIGFSDVQGNLVTNLTEILESPWSSTKKSTNNIKRLGFEFQDLNFSAVGVPEMFQESMGWILARHKFSPLSLLNSDSLFASASSQMENMYLSLLKVQGKHVAYIWTVRSADERSAYYVSTSFNPSFAQFSPGAFLFNSVIEYLRDSGYLWFDLGSGHHKYKSSVGTHTYKKSFAAVMSPRSLSEVMFETFR